MSAIVVIVPVLGRPQNAARVYESHQSAMTVPDVRNGAGERIAVEPLSRLVFVCSPEDLEQIEACDKTGTDVLVVDFDPGPGDFARKINHAYRETTEPWLFQAADDVRFEPGWDTAALACADQTGALVVGTQDGGNPMVKQGLHSTHTLVARSYVDDPGASMDGPGSVFSEAYGHQFCDVELVQLAIHRGVWAFAEEARVLHDHPFWVGRDRLDATYRKGMASAREDQRLYLRRSRLWKTTRRAA